MENRKHKLTEEESNLFNLLIDKYGLILSAAKTEEVLNDSKAKLYRSRKQGLGPKYFKDSANGAIRYPLHEIVHYICSTNEGEDDV